ncbi:MAG: hypothetical protein ACREJ2_01080, partial [Planctomycetota bacterium]
ARPTNTTPAVPLLRDVADNHELTVFLTMYRYLRIVRSNWVLVGGWALWMLAIGWLVARQWREAGRDAQRAEAGAGGRRASGDVVSWFTRRDRLAEEASLTAAERERWNGWHVSMWRLYALSWMFPAAWVGMIVAFALDPMARALTPEELRKAGGVTLVVLLMQGWSPRWLSMNLWERVVASGIVAGVAIAFLSPWIEFYSSKVGDSAFVCLFYAVIFLSLLPVACSVGMHYRRRAIRELVQARKALLPVGAVPVAPVHEEPLGERPGWDEGRP